MSDPIQDKKSAGKGVEDIAHFFLSSVKTPESESAEVGNERECASKTVHRVIGVVGQTPEVPTIFWSCQLAAALSQCGKRVLVIDVGTEPEKLTAVFNSVTIHPTLDGLLNQPERKIAIDSPAGFRILAFQMQLSEFRQLKSEEREILFQTLREEEQQSDIVLLNLHFDMTKADLLPYLESLQEAVVVVSPDDLFGAYRVVKVLFAIRPDLSMGLMEYGNCKGSYRGGIHRLVMASKEFLKAVPVVLGGVTGDMSVKAHGQMPTFQKKNPQSQALARICKQILQGLNGKESHDLFFEKIQSQVVTFNETGREDKL